MVQYICHFNISWQYKMLRERGCGYLEKQEWEPIEWQTRQNLSYWTIEVIGQRMKQDRILSNELKKNEKQTNKQ